MPTTPNKRPDNKVVQRDESASSEEEDTNLTAENAELRNREQVRVEAQTRHITMPPKKRSTKDKGKGAKKKTNPVPEDEPEDQPSMEPEQVDQRDESASSEEEDTNSTAENAELGNRDQVRMESLRASLAEADINGQHAGQDSTSSRPMAAAASPVDVVNLGHGGNTNPDTRLHCSQSEQIKKATYRLCDRYFTRDELASKTLTGKGKGKGTKPDEDCKLDENKVSTIVDDMQNDYPGLEEKVITNHIKAKLHICQRNEKKKPSRKNEEHDKQK